jgi:hypothetical protein
MEHISSRELRRAGNLGTSAKVRGWHGVSPLLLELKTSRQVEQITDPNTEEEERKVQENGGQNQQREATIPWSAMGDGGARKQPGGNRPT